jgi:hypothetical protein
MGSDRTLAAVTHPNGAELLVKVTCADPSAIRSEVAEVCFHCFKGMKFQMIELLCKALQSDWRGRLISGDE